MQELPLILHDRQDRWMHLSLLSPYPPSHLRKPASVLFRPLIPQLFSLTLFITSWATISCSGFCHVRNFTYLSVATPKTIKSQQDMAKVQIRSEKLTPFGRIFSIMEQFDSTLSSVIDSTSGMWQNKSYIPTPRATSCAWRTSHRLKENIRNWINTSRATATTAVTTFVGQGSPRFHTTYAPQIGGENFAQFIVNTVDNDATEEVHHYDSCKNELLHNLL